MILEGKCTKQNCSFKDAIQFIKKNKNNIKYLKKINGKRYVVIEQNKKRDVFILGD